MYLNKQRHLIVKLLISLGYVKYENYYYESCDGFTITLESDYLINRGKGFTCMFTRNSIYINTHNDNKDLSECFEKCYNIDEFLLNLKTRLINEKD